MRRTRLPGFTSPATRPRFDNAGTFRKSVNAGRDGGKRQEFQQLRRIEIQTGALLLAGGGSFTGSFDVPTTRSWNCRRGIYFERWFKHHRGGQFHHKRRDANAGGVCDTVSGMNLLQRQHGKLPEYFAEQNIHVVSGGGRKISTGTGSIAHPPCSPLELRHPGVAQCRDGSEFLE